MGKMGMRVASLFSGIGGIDLGFKQAGFDIVWANEFDKDAAITYRYNFGGEHLVEKDIRDVDASEIPDFDVLVAGFPCQPFSIMGRKKGFKDPRGNLFFEIARVLKEKKPSIVFLENVANLLEHDEGKTFLVIHKTLAELGYYLRYKVLDAKEYGNVPQTRRRIYIVAFFDENLCEKFHYPESIQLTTSIDDIVMRSIKMDDMYYYTKNSFYYDALYKVVTDRHVIYRIEDSGVSKHKNNVCPTLLANMGTFHDRVPVIKDDFGIRKITPQECLALQGFPSDFKFRGIPLNSAYKQCGNTVCVPVIKRIAEQINMVLNIT
jgi:DNA (cytosine-5)-methyltransferase 1